ncbi:hypothetical protein NDU88_002097 [Pleurodeles waltl]|uniref:Uncharacterized protein n=1 Tax=Pleurodeles waltl TaxID=8319 RepID=A0AAV7LZI9_PLEWA|nr:hypothetical protein NDU88_002096 [Pleurodeles waltl]KAJ1096967.1 hypothetical protein NDU88_002097 [Pleurodeles waltl]
MRDLGISSALQAGKGGIPRGNLHLGKGEGLLGVTSPVKVRSFRSWGLRVQGLSQASGLLGSKSRGQGKPRDSLCRRRCGGSGGAGFGTHSIRVVLGSLLRCWIATSRVGVAGCSGASLTLLAGSLLGSLKLLETKLQLFLEQVRCPREFLVFSKQGQSSEDVEVAGPFGRRRWSRIFGRQETGR